MLRRTLPFFAIISLLSAMCPAPALAMSTQAEIALGQSEDQQIVASSVMETDPLLNAYVQGIAGNLWNQVARKDLPYNVKIIKDSQINSFATMGGFVYINEGLIDFAQSDDELASVIGHETGHIERRHVITTNSKAEILDILFGLASIFSPIIYEFGRPRRSRLDGQNRARRRATGRPLWFTADVARRLRSGVDGNDDGSSGRLARRAQ